jgi:hypothetical protein
MDVGCEFRVTRGGRDGMKWVVAFVGVAAVIELAALVKFALIVLAVLQLSRWLLVYSERSADRRERRFNQLRP